MKYFKILKNDMKNDGFQYKEGLNTSPILFNIKSYRVDNLHFTDLYGICHFLNHGGLIAEVIIPKNIMIHKNGDQYSSHQIILQNIMPIENFTYWNDEKFCLNAVKQNGCALRYVKNKTNKIYLEAVRQNGMSLYYVDEQTEIICLEAVRQNGRVLFYVKNKTPEICLDAIKQDCTAIQFIKNKTPEICELAGM